MLAIKTEVQPNHCICCKGKKTISVSIENWGHPGSKETSDLPCVWCDGSGLMSDAAIENYHSEMAKWCRCGNPSRESTFYDDGERPDVCNKHHYVCHDCGNITQIG
jgi:hypothetical protein